jgi:hypothetical protein
MTNTVYTVAVEVAAQRDLPEGSKEEGQRDPHGDIGSRLVQLDVPGVLLQKKHLADDGEAGNIKKKPLQALEMKGTGFLAAASFSPYGSGCNWVRL